MPTELGVPTETDALTRMIDDARKLPAQMLPRPRSEQPAPPAIDLTGRAVRIPPATISLVDGYDLGT
ncbi:MAG TPA: hypothetical protein VFT62_10575 [Mycobacteriales bacterium]|nr:hypothetical protein [Mycobacteriales bacterium]